MLSREPVQAATAGIQTRLRASPAAVARAPTDTLQTAVRRANRAMLPAPHTHGRDAGLPASAVDTATRYGGGGSDGGGSGGGEPPVLSTTGASASEGCAADLLPEGAEYFDATGPVLDENAQLQLALERSVAEASEEERQITLALAASAADAVSHEGGGGAPGAQIDLLQESFGASLALDGGMASQERDELSLLLAQAQGGSSWDTARAVALDGGMAFQEQDELSLLLAQAEGGSDWDAARTDDNMDGAGQHSAGARSALKEQFVQLAAGNRRADAMDEEKMQSDVANLLAECEDEMLVAAMANSLTAGCGQRQDQDRS